MTSTLASGASEKVPFTQTFVQTQGGSAVTTQYTLVGQVLNNGQTNWVGYTQGSADYLFTSSAADLSQTTLADGSTYYVSRGSAPAGYLATGGSGAGASPSSHSVVATLTQSPTSGGMVTSSQAPDMTTTMPPSGSSTSDSGSAGSSSSTQSSGKRLSAGAVFAIFVGMMSMLVV